METLEKNTQRNGIPPAEQLRQLDIFVGKWSVEGQNLKGAPSGAGAMLTGIETYDWLTGGHFLINRWSRKFSDSSHIGIGIIGLDKSTGQLSANHFDNIGFARTYWLTNSRLTWKYTGEKERAAITFTPDGRSFEQYWEVTENGSVWLPLCRIHGSKVN